MAMQRAVEQVNGVRWIAQFDSGHRSIFDALNAIRGSSGPYGTITADAAGRAAL